MQYLQLTFYTFIVHTISTRGFTCVFLFANAYVMCLVTHKPTCVFVFKITLNIACLSATNAFYCYKNI